MNGQTLNADYPQNGSMKIKHSVEKPDGSYVYQGEFSGKELDFLVEFACNSLMAQGAYPFVTKEKAETSSMPFPTTDTTQ